MGIEIVLAAVAFVASAATTAYQVIQAKKMRQKALEAADARKGFEVVSEGNPEYMPLVYGRALVGGVRSWAATCNDFKFVAPNSDKEFLTGEPGYGSYTIWFSRFSKVYDILQRVNGTKTVNASTGGYLSQNQDGERNDFLCYQQALCVGPIKGVRDVIIDGTRYLNDPTLGSFGEIEETTTTKKHRGVKAALRLDYHYHGRDGVNDAIVAANFPERNDAYYTGLAWLSAWFRLNRDDPQFSSIPGTQTLVEGRLVRWITNGVISTTLSYEEDPTNYRFETSPPLCLLDYMLDQENGGKYSLDEIDLPSFEHLHNLYKTIVQENIQVGGKFWFPTEGSIIDRRDLPLYECNLIVDTSKPVRENIESFLATMGDTRLVWSNGKYRLSGQYPLSNEDIEIAAVITDDDLVLGEDVEINWPTAQDRFNFAKVRFHNEFENFAEDSVSWPPKYNANYKRGIGGYSYPAGMGSKDDGDPAGRLLNKYNVWDGTTDTTSLSWLINVTAEMLGSYTAKATADDKYTFKLFNPSNVQVAAFSKTTGDYNKNHVGQQAVDINAVGIWRVEMTGGNVQSKSNNKGVAGVIENTQKILWTSRSVSYAAFIDVIESDAVYNAMLAEDNNLGLEADIFADGITDPYHAKAKAEELVRSSRSATGYNFTMKIATYYLEPGDFIKFESRELDIGIDNNLFLRVDSVKVASDGESALIESTRFDYSQLAWAVKDDVYITPISTYFAFIPQPYELLYATADGSNIQSSGRLTCTPVSFGELAGYVFYMWRPEVDATDADGAPLFTEIGRTPNNYFDLPAIDASSAIFGVRARSSGGKLSAITTTNPTQAEELSANWARTVKITASDKAFKYHATEYSPTNITLVANPSGYDNPIYEWYEGDVQVGNAQQYVVNAFTENSKDFRVIVKETTDFLGLSASDRVTIVRIEVGEGMTDEERAKLEQLEQDTQNALATIAQVNQEIDTAFQGYDAQLIGINQTISDFQDTVAADLIELNQVIAGINPTTTPNLMENGDFENGLNDWVTGGTGDWAAFIDSRWGSIARASNAVSGSWIAKTVPADPGVEYTASADFRFIGTTGVAVLQVYFRDSNGTLLGSVVNSIDINVGREWSTSDTLRQDFKVTATAPANTAYGIVRLMVLSGTGITYLGLRRVKWELGNKATAFTSDASAYTAYQTAKTAAADIAAVEIVANTAGANATNALNATTALTTSLAILTNRVNASSSPNILPNGGPENGLIGWTSAGTGGTATLTAQDIGSAGRKYLRVTGATTTTAGNISNTDFITAIAGNSYSFAADSALSGSGVISTSWSRLGIIFYNSSNLETGRVTGVSMLGGYSLDITGANRQTLAVTNAIAPANTVKAKVFVEAGGLTNTGTWTLDVAQLKLERGGINTPYSGEASVAQNYTAYNDLSVSFAALDTEVNSAGGRVQQALNATTTADENIAKLTTSVSSRGVGSAGLPYDFTQDGTYWFSGYNGQPDTVGPLIPNSEWSFTDVASVGRVLQLTTAAQRDFSAKGAIPLTPGRRYRLTARVRQTAGTAGASMRLYRIGVQGATSVSNSYTTQVLSVLNTWYQWSHDITSDTLLTAGATMIRPMLRKEATAAAVTVQCDFLKIEDITDAYDIQAQVNIQATTISNHTSDIAALDTQVNSSGGRVQQALNASSTANSNVAILTTNVTSLGVVNNNLLTNTGGENGTEGVTSIGGSTLSAVNSPSGIGKYLRVSSSLARHWILWDRVRGTGAMSFTANIGHSGTGEINYRVVIICYADSSSGTETGRIYGITKTSHSYRASQAHRLEVAASGNAPAGTTYVSAFIEAWGTAGSTHALDVNGAKLETGLIPGPFTQEAGIQQTYASVNGLFARAAVRLDVNGYVTGWEANNNGTAGNFTIRSDYFRVLPPSGTTNGFYIDIDGSNRTTQYILDGSVRVVEIGWLS